MAETLTNLKIKLLEDDAPAYRIAAHCGIHPSILSEYALGKSSIKAKHLRALARYFKCPQSEILGTTTFEVNGADDGPF
jgi:transcriptional regulator with XRE-family HTH domain